jgi:hypothetical protein
MAENERLEIKSKIRQRNLVRSTREATAKEIFDKDGEEIIGLIVNLYIPDEEDKKRAFELWRQFKSRYLKEK